MPLRRPDPAAETTEPFRILPAVGPENEHFWRGGADGRLHLLPNTIAAGRSQGMQLMDSSIRELLERGVISAETARSAALDVNSIKDLL